MNLTSSRDERIRVILTSDLIKQDYLLEIEQHIHESPRPLVYLVSNGYINSEHFYPRLAELFGMPFIEEIPLLVDPGKSIAQSPPIQLLIDHEIYPYCEDDKLIIATSNPFLTQDEVEELLSYTSYADADVVFTHPNAVKYAIVSTYRTSFSILSEDYIRVYHPDASAYRFLISSNLLRLFFLGFLIGTIYSLIVYPAPTLIFYFCLLNTMYFVVNMVKFGIFYRALQTTRQFFISEDEIKAVAYKDLPVYTILVPLKNESKVVPHILDALERLDYPKDKLDIKFAVEVDDTESISCLALYGVDRISADATKYDSWMHLVKVPTGTLSTKPRSCNFALTFARGQYTVIYDAEDRPEPDQLKKVYLGFFRTTLNTICLQAKLNFYNPYHNFLTRFFSLEYGFWFDYYLPGLDMTDSPIPLGGTSNHFITSMLRKAGTWDSYNVTEDAELGLRIAKLNYQTSIIDSHTLEEANSSLVNWIPQRTRWQKGFLLTFLVHMSNPVQMIKLLKFRGLFMAVMTFGSNFFLPFINPVLWLLFIVTFLPELIYVGLPTFPSLFWMMGLFNLAVGNTFYIFIHALAAYKRKEYSLIPFALLMPLYWVLISVATYRALWQFIFKPFLWEKTRHGLR